MRCVPRTPSPSADSPTRGTRPSVRQRTDARIQAAVLDLVRTEGPAAVTIERVSELSGVARTTLYRRYPNRFDMLEHIATQIAPMPSAAAAPDLDGFTLVIAQIQHVFEQDGVLALVGHMLSSDDTFLREWRHRFLSPRLAILGDFMRDGVERGTIAPDAEHELITEFIIGGAIAESAQQGSLAPDWSRRVARALWPLLAHQNGTVDRPG